MGCIELYKRYHLRIGAVLGTVGILAAVFAIVGGFLLHSGPRNVWQDGTPCALIAKVDACPSLESQAKNGVPGSGLQIERQLEHWIMTSRGVPFCGVILNPLVGATSWDSFQCARANTTVVALSNAKFSDWLERYKSSVKQYEAGVIAAAAIAFGLLSTAVTIFISHGLNPWVDRRRLNRQVEQQRRVRITLLAAIEKVQIDSCAMQRLNRDIMEEIFIYLE